MDTNHATPELFAALAKAQNAVENATKGSLNPHFKNRYADLAEVLNTVRPVYSSFGLSIVQNPSFDGSLVSVTTALCHEGGGYITAVSSCVPSKSDAQGIGSACTYLRRYSLAAMTGVAQEDDDGQSASHSSKPEPVKAKAKPKCSKEQIEEIKSRAESLNVDIPAFEAFLGCRIVEMTQSAYATGMLALNAKQRKLLA